jgi:hypothetical protein
VTVTAAQLALGLVTVTAWQANSCSPLPDRGRTHYWAIVFEKSWMFQLLFAGGHLRHGAERDADAGRARRRERERERREAALMVAARDAELMALKASSSSPLRPQRGSTRCSR